MLIATLHPLKQFICPDGDRTQRVAVYMPSSYSLGFVPWCSLRPTEKLGDSKLRSKLRDKGREETERTVGATNGSSTKARDSEKERMESLLLPLLRPFCVQ